jgi:hypothetical protein
MHTLCAPPPYYYYCCQGVTVGEGHPWLENQLIFLSRIEHCVSIRCKRKTILNLFVTFNIIF